LKDRKENLSMFGKKKKDKEEIVAAVREVVKDEFSDPVLKQLRKIEAKRESMNKLHISNHFLCLSMIVALTKLLDKKEIIKEEDLTEEVKKVGKEAVRNLQKMAKQAAAKFN